MEEIILKAIKIDCLKNAIKFNGKCNPKAALGTVIKDFPEIKENMKELMQEINRIAEEVNIIPLEKQKQELLAHDSHALDKKPKQEKKDLFKELSNVNKEKGVIMRFAPSPSGPMHIGHVFSGMPTSIYVERYGGKFILRIEDTNPDNIYEPAYKLLPEDAEWIFGNVTDIWIQSDRIKLYYEYVEKLINVNAAYVCDCDNEKFKELIKEKKPCPCRSISKEENIKRWEKMLNPSGYKQGEVAVRFKADINNKNPALRDFPLARINESEHPRQGKKYRVWPLMNLSVTVDDIEAGMTHIIRAKEHQINAERQKMMYDALENDKFPETIFLGRWNFEGLEISCSKTKARIEKGEFTGWEDIRVPFLLALKRRGYQPKAFRKFVKNVGITANDKKMKGEEFFKALDSYNKDIIDPVAKRFFFITDPINVSIKNAPGEIIELDLHPDNIKGGRKFITTDKFLLSKDDVDNFKENDFIRLMDCFNITKQSNNYEFDSLDYEVFKSKGKKIIHWLPDSDNLINVKILMPDNNYVQGKAESNLAQIEVGDIIQFERFGFCRLDEIKDNIYKFWFTHK